MHVAELLLEDRGAVAGAILTPQTPGWSMPCCGARLRSVSLASALGRNRAATERLVPHRRTSAARNLRQRLLQLQAFPKRPRALASDTDRLEKPEGCLRQVPAGLNRLA